MEDTEAVLVEEFTQYGEIEKIETYKCLGDTFNALVTFYEEIDMDFVNDYCGVALKGNRIFITSLANEDSYIVDKSKYDIIIDV